MNNEPIVCLMGPTASGKTALACRLVEDYNAEIISVDSAMIYRGMDIGTATPTAQELQQYPHHLVSFVDPIERYSVARFIDDCMAAIKDVYKRGKMPVLAGGTMMYFHCLQNGLAETPEIDGDILVRLQQYDLPQAYSELQRVDADSAMAIKPTDSQRILRALAVYRATGQPLSVWQKQSTSIKCQYKWLNVAMMPLDRADLHLRIAQRFNAMMQQGFLDEVAALYQRQDLSVDLPSIRSVGYRQAWLHLMGEIDQKEMSEKAIIATRQLAKRQMTWIRNKWPGAKMLHNNSDTCYRELVCYLQHLGAL